MSDFDGGWKDVLDWFLPEFLWFFYRKVHADIDWTQEVTSLEQEFRAASPQSVSPMVRCDKLLRLHLRGEDDPAYIHVEVCCQHEGELPRRVFDYGNGATQFYRATVISLVLLGDDGPTWKPKTFARTRWGLGPSVKFGTEKILKHRGKETHLERTDNVMGLVVLAHLKALETRQNVPERRTWRLRLWRAIRTRGLEFERQQRLVIVIERFLALPEAVEAELRQVIREEEREEQMPYVTSFERLAKGEGLRTVLRAWIESRFGSVDAAFTELLEGASVPTLEHLVTEVRTASSLDVLRRILTSANR